MSFCSWGISDIEQTDFQGEGETKALKFPYSSHGVHSFQDDIFRFSPLINIHNTGSHQAYSLGSLLPTNKAHLSPHGIQ